jgi:hypothetical protein
MNDQILNSIVESYKEKGISTHDLLKDPLFLSLPLERQVEAVQAYAGVLAQGSKIASPGRLLSKAVLSGTLTGVFAGLPFIVSHSNPQTKLGIGIGAGILGAIAGGVSGALMHNSDKKRFETTNKYLVQLAQSPSIPTSVKVLDINRKFEPRTVSSILKGWASPEQALIGKSIEFGYKAQEHKYKELDKLP